MCSSLSRQGKGYLSPAIIPQMGKSLSAHSRQGGFLAGPPSLLHSNANYYWSPAGGGKADSALSQAILKTGGHSRFAKRTKGIIGEEKKGRHRDRCTIFYCIACLGRNYYYYSHLERIGCFWDKQKCDQLSRVLVWSVLMRVAKCSQEASRSLCYPFPWFFTFRLGLDWTGFQIERQ